MDKRRKQARDLLRAATRPQYERLIELAKLSPFQEKILKLHIVDAVALIPIADRFCCSELCVRHHLNLAYEQIANVALIDFNCFI